jgi:hypothetical protein
VHRLRGTVLGITERKSQQLQLEANGECWKRSHRLTAA